MLFVGARLVEKNVNSQCYGKEQFKWNLILQDTWNLLKVECTTFSRISVLVLKKCKKYTGLVWGAKVEFNAHYDH